MSDPLEDFDRAYEQAKQAQPNSEGADFNIEVRKLAQLKAHEYDKIRKEEANRLGVRTATLDAAVEAIRSADRTDDVQGRALTFPKIEPWVSPVSGAELLDDMAAHLQRFVVMPTSRATTATVLWALHCHAFDAAIHTPRLLVTSPTPECGKSQLIQWLAGVVPRPYEVIDPTGPNLFRPIEAHRPTVLFDEGDLLSWDERRDVRMVINAGHCVFSPGVPRCVGEELETRVFRVWAPLAYAMIGKPPIATMLSRSIAIAMERMAPDQQPEQRRLDRDQGFAALRRRCARWAQDNMDALRAADPELPLTGRKADCWRPLTAIADAAGGEWPAKARAAALALSAADEDADTIGVQLLADIKVVFDTTKAAALWTDDLLRHLHAMELRPWPEYGRARKPITPRQLARLLKPFAIASRQIWKPEGKANKHGYERSQFADPWFRYASPLEATESADFSDFPSASEDLPLADENPPKPKETATSSALADRNPQDGEWHGNGGAGAAFVPGADWADVPPGTVLPPGCEIEMDLTSGRQRARKPNAQEHERCAVCHGRIVPGDRVVEGGRPFHPSCLTGLRGWPESLQRRFWAAPNQP